MWPDSDFAVPLSSFLNPVKPPTVDPDAEPLVCLKVNRYWIAYILGALKQLVLQATWATPDPSVLALTQARAMTLLSIFIQALDVPCPDAGCVAGAGFIEDDMPRIYIDPETCKFMQELADGNGSCEIWSDLWTCIQQMIDKSVGGGQSQGGEIPVGECRTLTFRLYANSVWRSPYPVREGYTYTVTKAAGAWSDGTASWYCADGGDYILGECTGIGYHHETGDPDSTLFHGAVMTQVGTLRQGAWNGESHGFTGIDNLTDLDFMQNDAALPDNWGWLDMEVEVCNNSSTGNALDLVSVAPELNLTITPLSGTKWHVHAPYNNSPTGGGQPVTVAQVKLVNASSVNVGGHWLITNLGGWEDAASYTNNGAVYTGANGTGGVGVPHPLTGFTDWSDWFNTTYGATNIYSIDMRSTLAASTLEFDVEVVP